MPQRISARQQDFEDYDTDQQTADLLNPQNDEMEEPDSEKQSNDNV